MAEDYYHTKESVDEYIKMARDVNGSQLIEKFKNFLSPGSILLELGSGPGTDWKLLRKVFTVIGSDYSTEFLNRLIKNHPEGEFLNIDARTIKTEKKFDGIYSNKVLHHLNDEELWASLLRQHTILEKKGVICHSFWKGKGTENYHGLFVNYQTHSSLKNLIKEYFDILLLEDYKEFEKNDSILLIAKRK